MRIFKSVSLSLLAPCLLALVGCDSNGAQEGAEVSFPRTGLASQSVEVYKTDDDLFANFTKKVPGFGGVYNDELGRTTVLLTDLSNAEEARAEVPRFLQEKFGIRGVDRSTLVFKKAEHSFAELRNWDRASVDVMDLTGVTQMDIDDAENKIVVGVSEKAFMSAVQAALKAKGLPEGAFDVRVIAPTVIDVLTLAEGERAAPTIPSATTLQSRYRPVIGGLQIGFSGNRVCTLNSNVYRVTGGYFDFNIETGDPLFLTNSHCTDVFGAVDGRVAGQPLVNDRIGYEAYDPPMLTSGQEPDCPPGRTCRWSDAALYRYDGGISVGFGQIAKTNTGSTTISGRYDIMSAFSAYFFENVSPISKVGRTTGTSADVVIKKCVRTNQFDSAGDTGRTMLCQVQSNYTSAGGDSGSPIFAKSTATDPDREAFLQGIHWGTARNIDQPGAPVLRTMSPIDMVGRDFYLGYDMTLAVCMFSSPSDNCKLFRG